MSPDVDEGHMLRSRYNFLVVNVSFGTTEQIEFMFMYEEVFC
jgi:hypothetical protein